jgi:hypothetical protein
MNAAAVIHNLDEIASAVRDFDVDAFATCINGVLQ